MIARMVDFGSMKNSVLLASGRDGLGVRGDSWRFDGAQWTYLPQAQGLGARAGAVAAYASQAAHIVLAGGIDAGYVRQGDLLSHAGSSWSTLRDADTPSARQGQTGCYDPDRGRSVIHGGATTAGAVLGDTWEWDGGRWQRTASAGPTPRQFHAVAFDDQRRRSVLFGGRDQSGARADTWEWDGSTWNALLPSTTPPARQLHALARAPGGGLVMFGGSDATFLPLGDTWRWTGSDWTSVAGPAPTPRTYHVMAFDAERDQVVLFGGNDGGAMLADTWTFDGSQWSLRTPAAAPAARGYAGLAWDRARLRAVLSGGLDGALLPLADTWEWDGVDWLPVTTPTVPPPRFLGTLIHHAVDDDTRWFGGTDAAVDLGSSWRFAAAETASVAAFGSGCMGSAGTPRLEALGLSRPWLGSTYELLVSQLPPQPGFAMVIYGFSDVWWQTVPLPFTLSSYGMPGCQTWISVDDPFFVPHAGGAFTFPFPLPNDPVFAGFDFFNQVLVFDSAAPNPAGAVVSNAVRAHIGLR